MSAVLPPTISDLPDACLARVFHFLPPTDRNRCSLVCRYWLIIEGQSRHRLSLNAQSDLNSAVKSIFSRFDAVTKLSLKCDRRSSSINDGDLILISQFCPNLIRLKLRSCRKLTDSGIQSFTNNCNKLKKISFGSCSFGAKGMNAVLDTCQFLEELSLKRLIGDLTDEIKPGVAAASLKMISLKDLYNGQRFEPLIVGCRKLKTLRIVRCYGDYDKFLESVGNYVHGLVEIHLERLQVSDLGLEAVSKCRNLQILHLMKTPDCSDLGVAYVAEGCKLLRKIHIDGWKTRRIGDRGLISVAKNCDSLQELVLIGVDVTCYGLGLLCERCRKLERLALCGSDVVGDGEIACIAAKCVALRKLCIKSCSVSDHGIGALAVGCPNLVKVKVKKCKGVSSDGVSWLIANRESLMVNLDAAVNAANDSRALAVLPVDQDHLRQD